MKTEQFLPIPYCPNNSVSLCAVGSCYTNICDALNLHGIRVLKIPQNTKLSLPVQGHADLQLAVLRGEQVLIGKGETELGYLLAKEGFQVRETQIPLNHRYPMEAQLDFVSLGDRLIGHQEMLGYNNVLKKSQIIHVNQGYTKCNIVLINQNALITSDSSIANACRMNDFDVLQISPGFIELPGYSYGFIGGCCGLIAPDQLAICGELKTHPDYEDIIRFLYKHSINTVELSKGPLQDIGGIIPLKQQSNECLQ